MQQSESLKLVCNDSICSSTTRLGDFGDITGYASMIIFLQVIHSLFLDLGFAHWLVVHEIQILLANSDCKQRRSYSGNCADNGIWWDHRSQNSPVKHRSKTE